MMKATSKNTNDHIEYIPIILQKMEFTMAATMKPKTKSINNYMLQWGRQRH